MIDHDALAEQQYDTLDDQGQLSAAEIRDKVGMEVDGDFSAAAIKARLGLVQVEAPSEEIATDPEDDKTTTAKKVGSLMCGDCLDEVPAGSSCVGGHITNPIKGKPRVNG